MKKLERDVLLADRETVRSILRTIDDDDPLGRLSFESRLSEVEDKLRELETERTAHGSVALMFGGRPVFGSRSIDANFATKALSRFQDLLTKRIASEEFGPLGDRGRLPMRTASAMAISDVVRGSVGFVLEEEAARGELVDSAVKRAIDDVTEVIASTGSANLADFERAVESIDHRLLVSLRDFFKILDDSDATLRIVEDDRDEVLDGTAVRRGRERVDHTEIDDQESDSLVGELVGLVPDSRRFEMRLLDTGELIKGRVAADCANRYLQLIEAPDQKTVGSVWRTKMKIREVRERNKEPRILYLLVGLLEQIKR